MSNSLLHRSSIRMVTRAHRKLANDSQLLAITFRAAIVALVFSPSAAKATDYNWTGGSNDFNNANNWNPAPAIFNLGNNFFIAATAQDPFMSANTTVGNLTINSGILTLNSNFTLTTNGLTINNGGQFVSNNANTINGNVTINTGGSWQLNGSLVHWVAGYAAGCARK